jgi:hypothetical protein
MCKLVAFNLGDLDIIPFQAEVMSTLTNITDCDNLQLLQKRKMYVDFLMSLIDDKNIRLDIKRPGLKYINPDIKALTSQSISMFEQHLTNPTTSFELVQQDLLILLKLIKYQIDHFDRTTSEHAINFQSIFPEDFNTLSFIEKILG